MLAIEKGVPKILSLRQILDNYIDHQKEVIVRRTKFDKAKAESRAHILEGLRLLLIIWMKLLPLSAIVRQIPLLKLN